MKLKVTMSSDCDDGEQPTTSTGKSKRKNEESTRQSRRMKVQNEETKNVGVNSDQNKIMIRKTIWVKTTTKKGAKTNENGQCEAKFRRLTTKESTLRIITNGKRTQ